MNKEKYIETLKATGREGVDNLLSYLDTTDFYTAPASTKYHGSYSGGLVAHTNNVILIGRKKIKWFSDCLKLDTDYYINSITVAAAIHDLCKVDTYEKQATPAWKLNKGLTNKEYEYICNPKPPFIGHGEKSLFIAIREGLKLTDEETGAVRWHMGPHDPASKDNSFSSYYDFLKVHSGILGVLLYTADYEARLLEEGK